jgi:hypothetical protein
MVRIVLAGDPRPGGTPSPPPPQVCAGPPYVRSAFLLMCASVAGGRLVVRTAPALCAWLQERFACRVCASGGR